MRNPRKWITLAPLVGLALFALVVATRLQLASADVRRDANTLEQVAPLSIGETATLEILPLYEGTAAQAGLHTGLGVSYLVKTDTATILFDVGNNPSATSPSPLEQNMAALGISLDQVDMIVLSHTHFDHTGGQQWRTKGTFAVGGDQQAPLDNRAGLPARVPELSRQRTGGGYIPDQDRRGGCHDGRHPVRLSLPAWLAIPHGVEQSLIVNVKGTGLVVITGCGHMGLASLLAHVQAEFAAPVAGVVGGLHQGKADAQTLTPQIQLLSALHPLVVGLSPHDSGPAALAAFRQAFPVAYQPVAVGATIKVR